MQEGIGVIRFYECCWFNISANCAGKSVRLLSDSQSSAGGLVEICVKESVSLWTGVCHENFTHASATVVCRQLGLLRNDSSGMPQ